MDIRPPKGTHDIFNGEAIAFSQIENIMKAVSETYGYHEFRTPIIEPSELFTRSVGESSDVVRKEMYTFLDKGNRSITLRPEHTAGIARLIVNNKLYATEDLPIKAYYLGPTFRYERPQLGRYRQFNQFGVENIGVTEASSDAEVILLGYRIFEVLGLGNIKVKINSLGDEESRNVYRDKLKEFFKNNIDKMCEDCKVRYELNPLRILDCKVKEDQEIVKKAPKSLDYLTPSAKAKFDLVLKILDEYKIPYEISDDLVRGLDYYSETVFEYHFESKEGKDYGAIGAGGHYDKLIEEVGGPTLSGVGFSFGIERVLSVMSEAGVLGDFKNVLDFYVMPVGKESVSSAFCVAELLRANAFNVDICLEDKSLGQMFKKASKRGAKFAIIIGENEIKLDQVVIKNLETTEQIDVAYGDLINKADELLAEEDECDDDDCSCHEHE